MSNIINLNKNVSVSDLANQIRGYYNGARINGVSLDELSDDGVVDYIQSFNKSVSIADTIKSKSTTAKVGDFIQQIGLDTAKAVNKFIDIGATSKDESKSVVFGNVVDRGGYRDGQQLTGTDKALDYLGAGLEIASNFVPVGKVAKVASVGTKAFKTPILGAVKSGAKTGALSGGLLGLGQVLQTNDKDVENILGSVALNAAGGAVLGGGISGIGAGIGRAITPYLEKRSSSIISPIANDIANTTDNKVIQEAVNNYTNSLGISQLNLTPDQLGKYSALTQPSLVSKEIISDISNKLGSYIEQNKLASEDISRAVDKLTLKTRTEDDIVATILARKPDVTPDDLIKLKDDISKTFDRSKIADVFVRDTVDADLGQQLNWFQRLYRVSNINELYRLIENPTFRARAVAAGKGLKDVEDEFAIEANRLVGNIVKKSTQEVQDKFANYAIARNMLARNEINKADKTLGTKVPKNFLKEYENAQVYAGNEIAGRTFKDLYDEIANITERQRETFRNNEFYTGIVGEEQALRNSKEEFLRKSLNLPGYIHTKVIDLPESGVISRGGFTLFKDRGSGARAVDRFRGYDNPLNSLYDGIVQDNSNIRQAQFAQVIKDGVDNGWLPDVKISDEGDIAIINKGNKKIDELSKEIKAELKVNKKIEKRVASYSKDELVNRKNSVKLQEEKIKATEKEIELLSKTDGLKNNLKDVKKIFNQKEKEIATLQNEKTSLKVLEKYLTVSKKYTKTINNLYGQISLIKNRSVKNTNKLKEKVTLKDNKLQLKIDKDKIAKIEKQIDNVNESLSKTNNQIDNILKKKDIDSSKLEIKSKRVNKLIDSFGDKVNKQFDLENKKYKEANLSNKQYIPKVKEDVYSDALLEVKNLLQRNINRKKDTELKYTGEFLKLKEKPFDLSNKTLNAIDKKERLIYDYLVDSEALNTLKKTVKTLEENGKPERILALEKKMVASDEKLAKLKETKLKTEEAVKEAFDKLATDTKTGGRFIVPGKNGLFEIKPQTPEMRFALFDTTGYVTNAFRFSPMFKAIGDYTTRPFRWAYTAFNFVFKTLVSPSLNTSYAFATGRGSAEKIASIQAGVRQQFAYPFLLGIRLLRRFGRDGEVSNLEKYLVSGLDKSEREAMGELFKKYGNINIEVDSSRVRNRVGRILRDENGNITETKAVKTTVFNKLEEAFSGNDDIFGHSLVTSLYKKYKAKGMPDQDAITQAIEQANIMSPSASNLSDEARALNNLSLYAGISMQATKNFIQQARKYPTPVLLGGLVVPATGIAASVYALQKYHPTYNDVYDKLTDEQKATGILIPYSSDMHIDKDGKLQGGYILKADPLLRPAIGSALALMEELKDPTGYNFFDTVSRYAGTLTADIATLGLASGNRLTAQGDVNVIGSILSNTGIGKVGSLYAGYDLARLKQKDNFRDPNLAPYLSNRPGSTAPTNADIYLSKLMTDFLGTEAITADGIRDFRNEGGVYGNLLAVGLGNIINTDNKKIYGADTTIDIVKNTSVNQGSIDTLEQSNIANTLKASDKNFTQESKNLIKAEIETMKKYGVTDRDQLFEILQQQYTDGTVDKNELDSYNALTEAMKQKRSLQNTYRELEKGYGFNPIVDSGLSENLRLEAYREALLKLNGDNDKINTQIQEWNRTGESVKVLNKLIDSL